MFPPTAAGQLLLTTLTGSDIDTLVVAPRHVKREDFFDVYPAVLRKIAPDSVSSLTAVPDSFVPIIKLVFNDIDIDLIFVSIASLHTIPLNLELKDNKLLDSLDQPGVRAITGPVCPLHLGESFPLISTDSVLQTKSSSSCPNRKPSAQP
jgi:poly(A) polymerase